MVTTTGPVFYFLAVILGLQAIPTLASPLPPQSTSIFSDKKKRVRKIPSAAGLEFPRGGSESQDPYRYSDYNNDPTTPQQQQQQVQQQQQQQQQPYGNQYDQVVGNYEENIGGGDVPDHLFQESVQDRVDKWRQAQMERSHQLTEHQMANPRDESGRMKLLASVSMHSRAFIFFVMMWRDISLFETADQSLKGTLRLMAVTPLTLLFIANMGGVVASLMTFSHASKKRLKAILNLNKIVEAMLIVSYFFRLTIFPSKYIPREVYIASVLHSVFFIIQCQAFTRFTWDEKLEPTAGTGPPAINSQTETFQNISPSGEQGYVDNTGMQPGFRSEGSQYTDYDSRGRN